MGKFADKYGIQFRMLNKSKGPAVWGPRAQIDKTEYMKGISQYIRLLKDVEIETGFVQDLLIEDRKVKGVVTAEGKEFFSKAVILACGTFLNGLIHIGAEKIEAGRIGEESSKILSENISKWGIYSKRLKTGTPARVYKNTVDVSCLIEQKGDEFPQPFSFSTEKINIAQVSCFITHTNHNTHKTVLRNIHLSPMGSGQIKSKGPRYCPSIETKLINFPGKESHQIFIEPEGLDLDTYYLNGISNCFPLETQNDIVHTIKGLETCCIKTPAYAIEYDFFPPTQLKPTLETKAVQNLFFAGQINGTSGYEEAAAQGLIAAINASRKITGKDEFILKRSEAYIGVLIDDLVTKGTEEPYRMFTSRAEYRLLLRQDNADERLMAKGKDIGMVDGETWEKHKDKINRIYAGLIKFKKERVKKEDANLILKKLCQPEISEGTNVFSFLKRPEITRHVLSRELNWKHGYTEEEISRIEILIKYDGYLSRQAALIEDFFKMENFLIPQDYDYSGNKNLSTEAREKLLRIRPSNLGQAGRISGVTPSDIQVMMIDLKKNNG